jgi:pimeloyl-ACP methyl ester carboxylesterase
MIGADACMSGSFQGLRDTSPRSQPGGSAETRLPPERCVAGTTPGGVPATFPAAAPWSTLGETPSEDSAMTTTALPTTRSEISTDASPARGRIGLVVLGAMASGIALGLVLVLGVFGGGAESDITGGALLALGTGFLLLAGGAVRLTNQPQPWATAPGVAATLAGLAVMVLAPGDHILARAGWVWPVLLVTLVAWSARGAHRFLHDWSRRVLVYPALLVLVVVAAGGAAETVREATESHPAAAGQRYAVNGHELYLHCVGTGAPAVVLFNGLGERTPSWAWVQAALSSTTRVCAFDRAGEGWSGNAAGPQDGPALAADVHDLLRAAGVAPPYVIAGHSVGGTYALVYAKQYPRDVAGMALIDASTPYQFELRTYPGFYAMWRRASALLPTVSRTGLARVTLGTGFGGLPGAARADARRFAASPRDLRGNNAEFEMLPTIFDQAKALTTLGDTPLAVVSAEVGSLPGWPAAQARLAALSTRSSHEIVHGATHAALLEDRRYAAVSSRAIAGVVRAAGAHAISGTATPLG